MKKNRDVLIIHICQEDNRWIGRWPFWYALFHHKKVTPCNDSGRGGKRKPKGKKK